MGLALKVNDIVQVVEVLHCILKSPHNANILLYVPYHQNERSFINHLSQVALSCHAVVAPMYYLLTVNTHENCIQEVPRN